LELEAEQVKLTLELRQVDVELVLVVGWALFMSGKQT
jgi:hypothetical protein